MKQLDKFNYEVKPGETVTLVAQITGNAKVKVSEPMQPVRDAPVSAWKFTVPIQNPEPVYVIAVEVDFIDGSTPNSKVVLVISGSLGGSYEVITFTPASPLPECQIVLVVQ
jgi:hypothetical protein